MSMRTARAATISSEGAVVVGTGRAAIEAEVGVAGRDIAADQFVDMRHRSRGRSIPPGSAEVIAPQHDARDREPDTVTDPLGERAEIGRTHSGVAAELVHLVGGGLDQYDLIARPAVSRAASMTKGWAEYGRDARGADCATVSGDARTVTPIRFVAHICSF